MKKIAVTRLSGVVGKEFVKELVKEFSVYDLYHTTPTKTKSKKIVNCKLDLTNLPKISKVLGEISPDIILHLAAITHIDRCEEDKLNGKNGIVWKVNVDATKEISKYAQKRKKKLVFFSTECVFDGVRRSNRENDTPNPKNWYGTTKREAENAVILSRNSTIIRSVIAYKENDEGKTLLGAILNQLKTGSKFSMVNDQMTNPTYIQDIVNGTVKAIKKDVSGILHIVTDTRITPYNFALKVAKHFGYDSKTIEGKSLLKYLGKKRAKTRLKNSCLNGRKSSQTLNFTPMTVDEVFDRIQL